jgi:hypothetical protein
MFDVLENIGMSLLLFAVEKPRMFLLFDDDENNRNPWCLFVGSNRVVCLLLVGCPLVSLFYVLSL